MVARSLVVRVLFLYRGIIAYSISAPARKEQSGHVRLVLTSVLTIHVYLYTLCTKMTNLRKIQLGAVRNSDIA